METNEKQYRKVPEFDEALRAAETAGPITRPVAEALEGLLPAASEAAGRWHRPPRPP